MGYKMIPVTHYDNDGFSSFTITSDEEYDSASVALAARKNALDYLDVRFNTQKWNEMISACAEGPGDPEFDALIEQMTAAIREDGYNVEVEFDEDYDRPPATPEPPPKRVLKNSLG